MEKVCPNCHHVNDYGDYCAECGTRLVEGEASSRTFSENDALQEPAATGTMQNRGPSTSGGYSSTQEADSTGSGSAQVYLDQAKKVSQLYFGFFVNVLKRPMGYAQEIGKENFVNGLITIFLYSLIIPLMAYTLFHKVSFFIEHPFWSMFVKPFFGYIIFMMVVASCTYLAVRLGKRIVPYQEVISKFGALLVPFLGCMFIAFILALLGASIFSVFFALGLLGAMITIPALLISHYNKENQSTLDTLYGTMLTYILIFIALWIMGNVLMSSLSNFWR